MMKPKLYQYSACPFCSKVSTMLTAKKVDYDMVEVHPLKKNEIEFSKDYQKVPIYIDSQGTQVNDSTMIMRHIEMEFPETTLFEQSEEGKVREEKWLEWSEAYVQGLPAVLYSNLFNAVDAFNYITRVGKFGWWERQTIKYSGALIMTLVAKKIAKRLQIDPRDFLKQKVDEWGLGLEGKSFLGGNSPNAADVAVFGISRVVFGLKPAQAFQDNPLFMNWLKRMSQTTGISIANLQRP
ncbi:MAG: hypothetical protein EXS63_00115 [Candidatus Omnitrophica bacterium]|nr:hypothetical protein [Candidatus Omnitrophota bacterium]